jgi:hypothetical protein
MPIICGPPNSVDRHPWHMVSLLSIDIYTISYIHVWGGNYSYVEISLACEMWRDILLFRVVRVAPKGEIVGKTMRAEPGVKKIINAEVSVEARRVLDRWSSESGIPKGQLINRMLVWLGNMPSFEHSTLAPFSDESLETLVALCERHDRSFAWIIQKLLVMASENPDLADRYFRR